MTIHPVVRYAGGTIYKTCSRNADQSYLQWTDNTDCTGTFKVTVKQDSVNGKTVSSAKNLNALQYTTKTLSRGKTYYWRVTFCRSAGCANSVWRKFSIKP